MQFFSLISLVKHCACRSWIHPLVSAGLAIRYSPCLLYSTHPSISHSKALLSHTLIETSSVSAALYQEDFVLSSKGMTQLLSTAHEAHAENPCSSTMPAFPRQSGTHTSPCRAASLRRVGSPLWKHPPDPFAFIRWVGNCKDFMRAITNRASQGMIPSQGLCFQFRGFAFFLCLQILLVNASHRTWIFVFCSISKAYFEFLAGFFFMVLYRSPSVTANVWSSAFKPLANFSWYFIFLSC